MTVEYLLSGGDRVKAEKIPRKYGLSTLARVETGIAKSTGSTPRQDTPNQQACRLDLTGIVPGRLVPGLLGGRHGNDPRFIPVALCLEASNRWNQSIASRFGRARLDPPSVPAKTAKSSEEQRKRWREEDRRRDEQRREAEAQRREEERRQEEEEEDVKPLVGAINLQERRQILSAETYATVTQESSGKKQRTGDAEEEARRQKKAQALEVLLAEGREQLREAEARLQEAAADKERNLRMIALLEAEMAP